jgi:phosphatidate phosphatase APP1
LTYRVVSAGHDGGGRIQLLKPNGLSVISDIDDTIKITELPAGMGIVVRNTFFRDFVAVPGMARRYRDLGADGFHYVSGSPWQLFRPLSEFLEKAGFPMGSFHMKFTPKNVFTLDTWRSLSKLIGDATFNQKVKQISRILRHFPERRFILVGDSGERDPEVYRKIREDFGAQIQDIWIRDVVHRLEGMKIIDAPRIEPGVSQL